LIITAVVYFGITENFDQNIILFFSEHVGNSTLDIIMQYLTESGDAFNMLMFGILMLIIPIVKILLHYFARVDMMHHILRDMLHDL